ncbi:hypothetical protein DL93DRAFT_2099726 [Clavulina sp. PMI_390]|nr:hypothetical protein DL93DRAFT_2099726 [Clavulina sp. PMI_390]
MKHSEAFASLTAGNDLRHRITSSVDSLNYATRAYHTLFGSNKMVVTSQYDTEASDIVASAYEIDVLRVQYISESLRRNKAYLDETRQDSVREWRSRVRFWVLTGDNPLSQTSAAKGGVMAIRGNLALLANGDLPPRKISHAGLRVPNWLEQKLQR